MIEMILTIALIVVLVTLIRTKRKARRYQEDLAYYKREFTALRLRNIASTSNTRPQSLMIVWMRASIDATSAAMICGGRGTVIIGPV